MANIRENLSHQTIPNIFDNKVTRIFIFDDLKKTNEKAQRLKKPYNIKCLKKKQRGL